MILVKHKIELNDSEFEEIDNFYSNKKKKILIKRDFSEKILEKEINFDFFIEINKKSEKEEEILIYLKEKGNNVKFEKEKIEVDITSKILGIHNFKFLIGEEIIEFYLEVFLSKENMSKYKFFLKEWYFKGFLERGFNPYNELIYRDFSNEEDFFLCTISVVNSIIFLNEFEEETRSEIEKLKSIYIRKIERTKNFSKLIENFNYRLEAIARLLVFPNDFFDKVIDRGIDYFDLVDDFYE